MKQTRKASSYENAHIGPWSADVSEPKEIDDISDSLVTNSAIIKDFVRKEKQTKIRDFNDKITHISEYVSNPKHWNGFKKSAQDTSHEIFVATKEELLGVKKPIKRFRKKFEKIFSGSSSMKHHEIELLVKLAELKQKGVITTKEYEAKKKQILKKI